MAIAVENSIEIIQESGEAEHVFVFTEASTKGNGIAYTAVIGDKACIDAESRVIGSIEADLSIGGLYVLSLSPSSLSSRVYGGIVKFEEGNGIYFAVVLPDWTILEKLKPAQRWKFRYISFEYPRRGKRGFLLPTINSSPFAYCFITQGQKEMIEHLCPPQPVARFAPERYGYNEKELSRYLSDEGEKRRHATELCSIIDSIFERCGANEEQYIPMEKDLIPEEYRDYQMLYNADSLWDW